MAKGQFYFVKAIANIVANISAHKKKLFARREYSFFLITACRGEAFVSENGSSKENMVSANI